MYRNLFKFMILICVVGIAAGGLSGCGKKPAVETDPGANTGADTGRDRTPGDDSGTRLPDTTVDEDAVFRSRVQDVFFDYDRAELRSESRAILQENVRYLKENPSVNLVLEGHCDERGTTEYNLALGQRRADSVKAYLQDLGIASSRMRTVSYGEERPFAMGSTEQAWSQNRRVHFVRAGQ